MRIANDVAPKYGRQASLPKTAKISREESEAPKGSGYRLILAQSPATQFHGAKSGDGQDIARDVR
ncbi:MAG: hypothetical protein ABJB32_06340, partial [Verrucomicrobiota bacterium]